MTSNNPLPSLSWKFHTKENFTYMEYYTLLDPPPLNGHSGVSRGDLGGQSPLFFEKPILPKKVKIRKDIQKRS